MNTLRKLDGESTKKAVETAKEIIKLLDGYDYDLACYSLELTQQAIKQGAIIESQTAMRCIYAH